ncbi:MAG TPA: hypothetical protein ENG86_05220 [Nitrospirae bacterium]|nr:hypothetical protein [Nitrospirota bacterium]HDZ77849.1 hypothetical protein [Gammaproteobacteria bacterium]
MSRKIKRSKQKILNDGAIELLFKLATSPKKGILKLNGFVERANRTHTEEFYEIHDCSWTIPELNKQLVQWEYIYNCVRPHQSLHYKTPLQFLKDNGIIKKDYKPPLLSHMY